MHARMRNYATYQSVGTAEAHLTGDGTTTFAAKIPYSSKILDRCMTLAADAIDWKKRRKSCTTDAGPVKRGMGMASYLVLQAVGLYPYVAEAKIAIKHDGTINPFVGVVDIGDGQQTILGMIAAEELGVASDDVTVMIGDTQDTLYGPSCRASRCTPEMGPAVLQAAAEAHRKLFERAAPLSGQRGGREQECAHAGSHKECPVPCDRRLVQ